VLREARSPEALRVETVDDPMPGAGALLEAMLSGIAKRIGHPAYRGCPFLKVATEFPQDNHPGRVVARGNKEKCGQGSQPSFARRASVIPTVQPFG
jgi:hypothetical protein